MKTNNSDIGQSFGLSNRIIGYFSILLLGAISSKAIAADITYNLVPNLGGGRSTESFSGTIITDGTLGYLTDTVNNIQGGNWLATNSDPAFGPVGTLGGSFVSNHSPAFNGLFATEDYLYVIVPPATASNQTVSYFNMFTHGASVTPTLVLISGCTYNGGALDYTHSVTAGLSGGVSSVVYEASEGAPNGSWIIATRALPEPATLSFVGLAAYTLIRRRRVS